MEVRAILCLVLLGHHAAKASSLIDPSLTVDVVGAAGAPGAAGSPGAAGAHGVVPEIVAVAPPAKTGVVSVARVADIALVRSCGGSYTSSTGTITSPNYPGYYSDNTDCTYYVTSASSARIQLVFNYFELETSYDFLTISSGGVSIGRYTGSSLPPVLTLSSTVTLRFTTDISIVKHGFSVTFTTLPATCGGLVVGSGVVLSPGYPVAYSNNLRCVWGVVATQGKTVTIDFQAFNVENNYDWVELYDGNTLVARFSGTLLPPRATLGAAARVVFTTDSSVTYPGFSIAANSAALTCGGLISGSPAITSLNYPNDYPNNALCTWTYRVAPSVVSVRLTFTAFNLESNFDFVKIYDGQTLRNSDINVQRPGFRLVFTPQ